MLHASEKIQATYRYLFNYITFLSAMYEYLMNKNIFHKKAALYNNSTAYFTSHRIDFHAV